MAIYLPHDKYFHKARDLGLRSRAAFKLSELSDRYHLAFPGARVLDLGCAPGGWLAVLSRAVRPHGKVVGVDLARCFNPPPGVVTIAGDLCDPSVRASALKQLGGLADLVTSDLSPKLTGIPVRDQTRSLELLELALQMARECLKPGGATVTKVFMGADLKTHLAQLEHEFAQVQLARTKATRPGSAELYLVARNFRR